VNYLLDVNRLLAVIWQNHPHQARAFSWLSGKSVTVCPLSELGFIRTSTHPKIIGHPLDQTRALLYNKYSKHVLLLINNSIIFRKMQKKEITSDRVTVVCVRWGTAFSKDYVKVLYHGVKRNLSYDFDFVCLSDDLTPICDGIKVLPLPYLDHPEKKWSTGCWKKLAIFKPGIFPSNCPVLFLDLDVVILSSLDPIIKKLKQKRGLHILREWNPILWNAIPLQLRPDRGAQSSMFAFFPEEQNSIYNGLVQDFSAALKIAHNDQSYIKATAKNLSYLPPSWAKSFKKHCVHGFPSNLVFKKIKKPSKAMIVLFHGKPKLTDLIREDKTRWGTNRKFGYGPVDWVKNYWQTALENTNKI